jgi:hypothetical protein
MQENQQRARILIRKLAVTFRNTLQNQKRARREAAGHAIIGSISEQ